jgi:hypothetical protein
MPKYACPICGDPHGFPIWIDKEPPIGCPKDMSWHDGSTPLVKNVTECEWQMKKAWQAAEFRKLVPHAFDENGNMLDGQLGRVLECFHAAHPDKYLVL